MSWIGNKMAIAMTVGAPSMSWAGAHLTSNDTRGWEEKANKKEAYCWWRASGTGTPSLVTDLQSTLGISDPISYSNSSLYRKGHIALSLYSFSPYHTASEPFKSSDLHTSVTAFEVLLTCSLTMRCLKWLLAHHG
ncbi:hypothetical protein RJT34_14858 [Clitoria ternatea]|uniref:Uncharacterized protein n=1 Tax=Clitoria ternatea TaxID=43366 RepID=A0AAN9PN10_CLITE